MQLAYQAPLLQVVASNAPFLSDYIRVPVGSTIRLTFSITAIVGAPAATLVLYFRLSDGSEVNVLALPLGAVGSTSGIAILAPEFFRTVLFQAGGANTLTASIDLIVQPPATTPA